MTLRDKSETVQLSVRLRAKEPLRAALAAAALERGVSMNTEIVDRLTLSFRKERVLSDIKTAMREVLRETKG